jgi:hypothetical protein
MPATARPVLRAALSDVAACSLLFSGRPLRPYQAETARALARAALSGRGETLTVMMARQMGKNELLFKSLY